MKKEIKVLTYQEWEEKYKPILNLSREGYSFETIGDDWLFVTSRPAENIWTSVACPDEEIWILPGFHIVDRQQYFVTEIPWEDGDFYNLQVNDNEMIPMVAAVSACIKFLTDNQIMVEQMKVSKFFEEHKDRTFVEEMTTGRAKYLTISFYEESTGNDFPDELDDFIHDFFNQL